MSDAWLKKVEESVKNFAKTHSHSYCLTKKQLSASFEIGCFHALLNYYEKCGSDIVPENIKDKEFKYLTTPAGNPNNFSYVSLEQDGVKKCEIRQQVRVRSHIDEDIAFTPDIVVIKINSEIHGISDNDYAKGAKKFYSVDSSNVIAAHECKSMTPFPELMVSFIGMVVAAHKWYSDNDPMRLVSSSAIHLAPTLFVGGCASGLHLRMIAGMQRSFPLNVIVGLHQGTWNLYSNSKRLNRLRLLSAVPKKASKKLAGFA